MESKHVTIQAQAMQPPHAHAHAHTHTHIQTRRYTANLLSSVVFSISDAAASHGLSRRLLQLYRRRAKLIKRKQVEVETSSSGCEQNTLVQMKEYAGIPAIETTPFPHCLFLGRLEEAPSMCHKCVPVHGWRNTKLHTYI
jgi:hypothetical protein